MPPPLPPTLNDSPRLNNLDPFINEKDTSTVLSQAFKLPLSPSSLISCLSVSDNNGNDSSNNNATCHGRIQDLTERVPYAWWKTVFADELYLKTDGDVVEDADITLEEVRILEAFPSIKAILDASHQESVSSSSLSTSSSSCNSITMLDLCCGQGRHLLQIADLYKNIRLFGHDQSQFLIQLAQSRALAAGLNSRAVFTLGDCRSIPHSKESMDLVIMMGNSFGYAPADNSDREVLSEVYRVLKPGGRFVLDLSDGAYLRKHYSPRGWEWVDDTTIVCRERQLSSDMKRLVSREVVIVTNKGVIRDQFYQERLYDRSEVEELFAQVGLIPEGGAVLEKEESEVTGMDSLGKDPSTMTTASDMSKRGQDLGMMEQRQLMLAYKPLL